MDNFFIKVKSLKFYGKGRRCKKKYLTYVCCSDRNIDPSLQNLPMCSNLASLARLVTDKPRYHPIGGYSRDEYSDTNRNIF
jgi:hypothetical protein